MRLLAAPTHLKHTACPNRTAPNRVLYTPQHTALSTHPHALHTRQHTPCPTPSVYASLVCLCVHARAGRACPRAFWWFCRASFCVSCSTVVQVLDEANKKTDLTTSFSEPDHAVSTARRERWGPVFQGVADVEVRAPAHCRVLGVQGGACMPVWCRRTMKCYAAERATD